MKLVNGSFSKAAVTLTAVAGLAATATAAESPYTMTTIVDSAWGGEVAAGNYVEAIQNLAAEHDRAVSFEDNTNLCVAYTKTRNLDAALLACDTAVKLATAIEVARPGSVSRSAIKRARSRFMALALSNRGVLFAVAGEREKARRDFTAALEIGTFKKIARVNLARLGDVVADNA